MLTLALDTATPRTGAALLDGDRVLATSSALDPRRHAELLAPAVAAVLAEAGADRRDLRRVAVGVGPGPFTGLRVGVVTARTLGAALGVPVVGVCTLDALALGAARALEVPFAVATDARRREVYWAAYGPGAVRTAGPAVGPPASVPADLPVVGHGALLHALPGARAPEHPDPADVGLWVAEGRPVLDPVPLYLRRPDAAEPGARKRVLA
ncbi:tRNA (adenosine(37)-N6)-threonylcarbamoyltransferase complex dimerization subunit type 1 TsaB [Vallicoccus soli]|uniref:tRNA (Adenosine(37)-N6)-threonylcarbamoyltransferase complex dimerization subunit type 1 TsaB n=1 Tax=Vallicoccus soli TaxID=2339232 RepID=A0A3A3YTC2_9ACTN|nr:tRNA (adenosine(37)-N6)-threonylcarbamoyltransferase complex dimerization subunit type 1 TsaB [Vallicoccus soli]RJK93487.1 tRNA (adenosine(37)-N6)-threonylcarbamoyltransferase complex dimerization subunit type 1 TsaB [Vallicoccus soli]